MRKLVVCNMGFNTHRPFASLYSSKLDYHYPDTMQKGDALVLEGGCDIQTSLYKEKPGRYTQMGNKVRDQNEISAFQAAVRRGAGIIGVCRGAQLITALLGGKLVQDVTGHNNDHSIITDDGRVIQTSSLHHQMMLPGKIPHQVFAWSLGESTHYLNGDDDDITDQMPMIGNDIMEPEIVWYPQVKALAIQGHPEYMSTSHPFNVYCRELISKLLIAA